MQLEVSLHRLAAFAIRAKSRVAILVHQAAAQREQKTGAVEELILETKADDAISRQFSRNIQHLSPGFGRVEHQALIIEERQRLGVDGYAPYTILKSEGSPAALGNLSAEFVINIIRDVQQDAGLCPTAT